MDRHSPTSTFVVKLSKSLVEASVNFVVYHINKDHLFVDIFCSVSNLCKPSGRNTLKKFSILHNVEEKNYTKGNVTQKTYSQNNQNYF